jgi:hypothetical protein
MKLGLPLKVRVFRVVVIISLAPETPPTGRATVAAVMCKSFTPNALEKRTRISSPPMVMWRVWRMVELKNTELDPF